MKSIGTCQQFGIDKNRTEFNHRETSWTGEEATTGRGWEGESDFGIGRSLRSHSYVGTSCTRTGYEIGGKSNKKKKTQRQKRIIIYLQIFFLWNFLKSTLQALDRTQRENNVLNERLEAVSWITNE